MSEANRTVAALAVALAALSIAQARAARAQEIVPIRDADRCKTCEITLEHVVTLGDREGPGRVGPPTAEIVRDRQGNYYVAHGDGAIAASRVWVFSPTGQFLRTFGRKGDGPGEYRGIVALRFLPGDTLELYSFERRTVLDPDLTVVRTSRLQISNGNRVFLPDGRSVVGKHLATPGRVGYPLQLVTDSGTIVRSFGAIRPEYRRDEPFKLGRAIMAGPDGGSVWSVGATTYLIELWDTSGTRRAAFQRDVDWFEPWGRDLPPRPNGPTPQPRVGLVTRDSVGRLWVSVLVAAEHWREGFTRDANGRFRVTPGNIGRIWDTVLEVIDPVAERLVASRRFQGQQIVSFIDNDLIVTYREDETGYPSLDVWRMSVTTR